MKRFKCIFYSVRVFFLFIVLHNSFFSYGQLDTRWRVHATERPLPPKVEPPPGKFQLMPPSDAIVLFDGKSLDLWRAVDGSPAKWKVVQDYLECVPGAGNIKTLQNFGDCQLHIEWQIPQGQGGIGQDRGNSGIFLMGLYEVQILDTFTNRTYADGYAGAVYGQYPPLVNASRPQGEWQSFDIIFNAPRFDEKGALISPARMTVLHNGVLVQNNVELSGPTGWLKRNPYAFHFDKLPLQLQDHGCPVRFRNIWIRDLSVSKRPEFTFSTNILNRYVGLYRFDDGLKIEVSLTNNVLYADIITGTRRALFPLFASDPESFFIKSVDAELTFRKGATETYNSIEFLIGGQKRFGKRIPVAGSIK